MKIITCTNQKGGVGKTTLACHLSWYLAELGQRTLLIDLDMQKNASSTLEAYAGSVTAKGMFERVVAPLPSPPLVLAPSSDDIDQVDRGGEASLITFAQSLQAASEHFDAVVIDTPAALEILRTIAALYVCDFAIAPIDLGQYAVDGVGTLLRFLDGVAHSLERKPIEFLGFLAMKFQRTSRVQKSYLEQLAADFGPVLFPHAVPQRDPYSKVPIEKKPVWKLPGASARDAGHEMRDVLKEITERMGIGANA